MEIKELINSSDLAIEVVDARFPYLTRIKEIEKNIIEANKNFLLVVNKIDLVSKRCLHKLEKLLKEEKVNFCFISVKNRKNIGLLRKKIKKILKNKKSKCCIFGLPNTGKSSLINLLRGRHVAGTSIKPGFTRGYQYIRLTKDILLIDTPGIFIPNLDEKILVFLNAIDLDKVKNIEIAAFFVLEKIKRYKVNFENFYNIKLDENFFVELAKKFKYYLKNGELDLIRAYKKFLMDWYKGKIKVCFFDKNGEINNRH